MSNSEENRTLSELKIKTIKLDYDVLNITVFQNLSNAPNENADISDYPIIHQTNGTILFKSNSKYSIYNTNLIISMYFNFRTF